MPESRVSRLLLGLLFGVLLVGAGAPAYAAGSELTWGVAPADGHLGKTRPHFVYTARPGGRIHDALQVVNLSDRTISLRIYASDGLTTPIGGLDLLPAGTRPTDLGAWIKVARSKVTLAPQQRMRIPFVVHVPANAGPGDHTGGVVTSLVTDRASDGVRVDRRLGSRVYLRVRGALHPTLRLSDVRVVHHGTLDPFSSGSATVSYTVTNIGNVRLGAHQSVRVSGIAGLLSRVDRLDDLPELLPGARVQRTVVVNHVWPGVHLSARLRLDPVPGDDLPAIAVRPVEGEAATWALPWGQLVVLAALVAVVFLLLVARRRRKARVAAAVEEAVSRALESARVSSSEVVD